VVIGNMIYNDESSVCKAAVHSGLLVDDGEHEALLEVANGEDLYESANQNGI
jgi:hypothetical protein